MVYVPAELKEGVITPLGVIDNPAGLLEKLPPGVPERVGANVPL
jgi:hypothetical protein